MRSPFLPGALVRARGRDWNLRDVTEHDDCVALGLAPWSAAAALEPLVLLHPFDRIEQAPSEVRPALVSRPCFWRSLASRAVSLRACDALVAPAGASIDILPFQLEPAIAMALNGVSRLLLADAVGLGKTVQAGLIVAELLARGEASRVLVLVPAALREQWAAEFRDRFGIEADIIDAAALRALGRDVPGTVSPWTIPRVAVVSIDFAKRPDVRSALGEAGWDVVIVDEAHMAPIDSDRHHATHLIASRADRVILLTATPHSGHEGQFAALTALGAVVPSEPLAVFRRSRSDVGIPSSRHSRLLRIRLSYAETAVLRLLIAYLREIWSHASACDDRPARLVAVLLLKRALSTPGSLARSVARRRALLGDVASAPVAQMALPLDDERDAADDEPVDVLAARGLSAAGRESVWLDQVAAALEPAVRESRKLRAVERLARRAREPIIVFSEYRDTLLELERTLRRTRRCATLHGGLDRADRVAVLESFAAGQVDVLLATDAAGAGLNLHHRCRTVVNLELPWNPVRLEQRAGRVDRIGQTRTVHAVHLVARATPEERVLARLIDRAGRARAALCDTDATWLAMPAADDETTAEACLGFRPPGGGRPSVRQRPPAGNTSPHISRVTLTAEGRHQADRQTRHRLVAAALARSRTTTLPDGPPGAQVRVRIGRQDRHRGAGAWLTKGHGDALAVFEVHIVDAQHRLVDEHLVTLRLSIVGPDIGAPWRTSLLQWATCLGSDPRVADALAQEVRCRLGVVSARRPGSRSPLHRRREAQREARRREYLESRPYQAGLFERRAERAAEEAIHTLTAGRVSAGTAHDEVFALVRPPRLGWLWWPGGS